MEKMELKESQSSEFEYPVHELIQKRRSKRAYSSKLIEPEKIYSLFEAARWAPSSMNEQPWTYIYATREQDDLWTAIFNSLNESNQIWVKDAPLLVVSLARKNFVRNDQRNHSAVYDMGAANAFLSLQATELGLNVHQMGGYRPERLSSALNVPSDYDLGVVMAIGYLGDEEKLPNHLQERERNPRFRRRQKVFVMNSPFAN